MWALVTGGSKKLGAELCKALAYEGYNVVVHYRTSQQAALEVVKECQAIGVQAVAIEGDFASMEKTKDFVQRYLKQIPETDILINNIGNYLIQSALATSIEDWLELFQTNLHAPFVLIKNLVPSLIRKKGSVISIGVSGIENVHANTYSTAYSLTKLSLWMLTRSLALELAPQGVRVNMVSPGHLVTSVDLPKDLKHIPMQRPAEYGEISRVVTFLLKQESSYITGQNIEVAGGTGL